MRDGDKKSTHIWCMFAPFFCSYYFSTIISNCRIFDITHRYVETQAVAIHVILPIDVDLRIARRETEAEQWKKLCLLDWCYLTCVVLIALVKLRFGNAFSFRWLLFFVVFFFRWLIVLLPLKWPHCLVLLPFLASPAYWPCLLSLVVYFIHLLVSSLPHLHPNNFRLVFDVFV